ncbi:MULTISPECIES: putative toxin [unclassified Nocardia]|uniref:putative toxin n=1 Tax=unclassified Nocardia TaxID=2637762 RepID=UPI0033AE8DB9
MTDLDPESYYNAARQLTGTSRDVERDLRALNTKLTVANSAGSYFSGGTKWGQNFDQAATDIFEVASTSAMAARELGYQVHQAGLNHANAENTNNPGANQPTPPAEEGTTLAINLQPGEFAAGGQHDTPSNWDLLRGLVTRPWADSDPVRISKAGMDFGDWGRATKRTADTMRNFAVLKWSDAEKTDVEVSGIIDEINNVHTALHDSGELGTYLETACKSVGKISEDNRSMIIFSLNLLRLILLSYEADKIALNRLPGFISGPLKRAIEKLEEKTKKDYATAIDGLLKEINDKVDEAIGNCEGIYAAANGDVQFLAPILNRTPRNAQPIRFRNRDDNDEAGDRGEERAGIPLPAGRRGVNVNGETIYPDYIDVTNKQVVEVKNANDLDDRSRNQIKLETVYAQSQGYTMILVTDHRTVINDPDIQHMIDTGQIQLVRKELDDNNDAKPR